MVSATVGQSGLGETGKMSFCSGPKGGDSGLGHGGGLQVRE